MNEQGLTVKQLRKKLAAYPDDMEVFVDGYEGGLDSLLASHVARHPIKKNVNLGDESWWDGHHKKFHTWDSGKPDCEGVVLSR